MKKIFYIFLLINSLFLMTSCFDSNPDNLDLNELIVNENGIVVYDGIEYIEKSSYDEEFRRLSKYYELKDFSEKSVYCGVIESAQPAIGYKVYVKGYGYPIDDVIVYIEGGYHSWYHPNFSYPQLSQCSINGIYLKKVDDTGIKHKLHKQIDLEIENFFEITDYLEREIRGKFNFLCFASFTIEENDSLYFLNMPIYEYNEELISFDYQIKEVYQENIDYDISDVIDYASIIFRIKNEYAEIIREMLANLK